jgi:hypothetical protein
MSNFSRLLDRFKYSFPSELESKVDIIENFVVNYIRDNEINVKFLNSCSASAGFKGVRTRDQIIICSPISMETIGDFLYTIFHEIRHEQQIRDLKMINPLTDFDLEDFEALYEQYWDMELDADKFAKEMVARLVIKLEIPIEIAKKLFSLSPYVQQYPTMSNMVRGSVQQIINDIKRIKKSGGEYTDIQDHPIVKRHIDKLEDFI